MANSVFLCNHANECPNICPCEPDCYCKSNTCRPRGDAVVLLNEPFVPHKRAAQETLELLRDQAHSAPRGEVCGPECQAGRHGPERRIAFCGASGTGKTTLSQYVAAALDLDFNPVGSRSVSKAMGFDSPYDVDKAGRRAEFQHRLVTEKRAWENARGYFVTDRTTLDNLAYTMLHDVHAVDKALLNQVVDGLDRYTHIIYCPSAVFCNPDGDPSRIADMTYHHLYDAALYGLIRKYMPKGPRFTTMTTADAESRRARVRSFLGMDGLYENTF